MTKQNLVPTIFDRSFLDNKSLNSLLDHSVGLDDFFGRVFDDFLPAANSVKYPPYNIRKDDETTRTIEMALAGYGEGDIEITLEGDILTVKGNKVANLDDSSVNYVYKGVSARAFERKFVIAEGAEVTEATLKDGMLHVTVKTTPETVEVKRIEVNKPAATVDAETE